MGLGLAAAACLTVAFALARPSAEPQAELVAPVQVAQHLERRVALPGLVEESLTAPVAEPAAVLVAEPADRPAMRVERPVPRALELRKARKVRPEPPAQARPRLRWSPDNAPILD